MRRALGLTAPKEKPRMSDYIDKAKQMAADASDTTAEGIKNLGDKIDEMTGGKTDAITDKVGDLADQAAEGIKKLAGKAEDAADAATE